MPHWFRYTNLVSGIVQCANKGTDCLLLWEGIVNLDIAFPAHAADWDSTYHDHGQSGVSVKGTERSEL